MRLDSLLGDEEGATLVMFALWLPVLALFLAFVVDAGNWWVHYRHLQSQADAAALGGAQSFLPGAACQDGLITATVHRYAGDQAGSFNAQIGSTGQVTALVNSLQYYDKGGSDYSDTGSPCASQFVDVKMTEANIPVFFAGLLPGISPTADVNARATMETATIQPGNLPLAISESAPSYVRAEFVNAGGSVIASSVLSSLGSVNGYDAWSDVAAPVAVNVQGPTYLRLVLAGGQNTACGQALVECYDNVGFVHGYDPGASAPAAYDVQMASGSCGDGYFVELDSGASCSVGVQAAIDLGADPAKLQATATASVNGSGYPLSFSGGYPGGSWSTSGINVSSDQGALPVTISWAKKTNADGTKCKKSCSGSFTSVQEIFAGGQDSSGPLHVVQLVNPATSSSGYDSVQNGSHSFVVNVSLQGLEPPASAVSDKPTYMRVASAQGLSLDCDPSVANLRTELAQGCKPRYRVDQSPYVDCQALGGNVNQTQPWPCIRLQPGASIGQADQGLSDHVLQGGSCAQHPNNWASFPNLDYQNDSRVTNVFVVPFGALTAPANSYVPVKGLATFYITGWGNDSCAGDTKVTHGSIIGHFIKKYDTTNYGSSGPCVQNQLAPCVPVLTK